MSSKSGGKVIDLAIPSSRPLPHLCSAGSISGLGYFTAHALGVHSPALRRLWACPPRAQYPGLHRTRLQRLSAEALGNPITKEAGNVVSFLGKMWINASTNLSSLLVQFRQINKISMLFTDTLSIIFRIRIFTSGAQLPLSGLLMGVESPHLAFRKHNFSFSFSKNRQV